MYKGGMKEIPLHGPRIPVHDSDNKSHSSQESSQVIFLMTFKKTFFISFFQRVKFLILHLCERFIWLFFFIYSRAPPTLAGVSCLRYFEIRAAIA
jgi:hypothetical protein